MKNKKIVILVFSASFLFIAFAIGPWLIKGKPSVAASAKEPKESEQPSAKETEEKKPSTGPMEWVGTGPMSLGKFIGQVVYDEEKDYYFLELRGARFPFKTSPIQAQEALLEAPGKNELEKNTSLLYGILGPEVLHATLLINPDEEDDVMPAASDIAQYIQIVNRRKFAGLAYTKPGGKLKQSVVKGSQIQALKDATSKTPIIQIKGPKSGARDTKVSVMKAGKVVVEGKTYEELYKAADLICITLLKMLCGSPDCPNAAACATGGDCGC